MYAIVSIAGQQFKVEKDKKIFVHRLPGDEGSVMDFDKVILIDNEGKVKLGNPYIDKALVTAKIVSHVKGDKVLVFKKKRRKGYRKLNGHRQYLTEIIIDEILENAAARKSAPVTKKETKEKPVKAEPVAKTAAITDDTVVKEKPVKTKKPAVKKAEKEGPEVKKTAKPSAKAKPVAEKVKKTEPKAKADGGKAKKAEPKAKADAGKAKKAEPKAKADAGKAKKAEPKAKADAGKAKKAEPKAHSANKKK